MSTCVSGTLLFLKIFQVDCPEGAKAIIVKKLYQVMTCVTLLIISMLLISDRSENYQYRPENLVIQ